MNNRIYIIYVVSLLGLSSSAQWTDNGNNLTTTDNVGIGTTNPQGELHISGGSAGKIRLTRGTGQAQIGMSSDVNSKFFDTGNNGSDLFINSSGNIGIGTTNPQGELHISGGSASKIRLTRGTGQAQIGMSSDVNSIFFDTGNNGSDLFINSSGNVGIGTANPTSKVQLMDGNNGLSLHANNDWEGIGFNRSARTGQILNTNKTAWQFTARDERFSLEGYNGATNSLLNILKNGNVGIGTKNPDMKLTVKGNIHAEEVKIDLNVPAPDYVFKEGYKLRTIEEVEQFIKENHHLPEMPSAREFEENGIMQAEMDMNLLKKIEELTLYTIRQEKEIEHLKKENEKMKSLDKELFELRSRLEKLESEK